MGSSGVSCRATALTTPSVTDDSSPSGLPNASTIWPGRSVSESPNGRTGRPFPSTLITATSVS